MGRRIPLLLSFGGSLHLDFRRLSRVNDELLKVSPIDGGINSRLCDDLFCHETHSSCLLREGLRIRQERSRVSHPRLVLVGVEGAIDGDLQQSEVSISSKDFKRFREEPCWEHFF